MSYYNTVTMVCDACELEEENRASSQDLPDGWVEIRDDFPYAVTLQEGAYNLCSECYIQAAIEEFHRKWVREHIL